MTQQTRKQPDSDVDQEMPPWRDVFLYFFFLGFVNIGGPVAQITMMYNHMVERKHWLSDDRFIKIMSFCHMLPGPEALQLAIYVGYLKRRRTRDLSGFPAIFHLRPCRRAVFRTGAE